MSIRHGLVLAALILGTSSFFKLAHASGLVEDAELGRRLTMVVVGLFLASIGNATPKMLTPLSELRCDGVTAQALQRFTGWTWVLTGLAFSFVWLVLPRQAAQPVSVLLIACGAVAVLARLASVCWPRGTRA